MNYKIVLIGASLGGLQAIKAIIEKLPKDFLLPIVIIQHRERNADDTLQTLLENYGNLKVVEPDDKDELMPNVIYLAPANYHLLIEENHFVLSEDELVNWARPSIDVTFESAAEVFGDAVIGIILTGNNSDGSKGLKEIKESGGFTIVQDPENAGARSMPQAALELVKPDKVLNVEMIGEFLIEICNEGSSEL